MSKDLDKFCYSLSEEQQLKLALQLVAEVMPIWDNFSGNPAELHYIDTLAGTPIDVEAQLLNKAMASIVSVNSAKSDEERDLALEDIQLIWEKFGTIIPALQNQDWEVPYPVERAIYAVYNIVEYLHGMKLTIFDEGTLYVSVNQSIDALINTGRKEAEDIIDILDQYGEYSTTN